MAAHPGQQTAPGIAGAVLITPLMHEFVRANGLTFHVARNEREGPLAVFLHGFPECWYSWRMQLPALALAGYRAWAPDLRGYNLSDKPPGIKNYHLNHLTRDVVDLIHAAGAEAAVVIGHDWGGVIAWRVAMNYPEVVSNLVVMNVPHPAISARPLRFPRQILRSWYIGFFQIPWLPEWFMSRHPRYVVQLLRQNMIRREAMNEEDIEIYAEAIGQAGAMRAAINYYRALARGGWQLPVEPIRAPTLMLWGENDIALEKALTFGTEKYVADFRIHYIPRCGHWVQQEAPDEVNRLLVEFLT